MAVRALAAAGVVVDARHPAQRRADRDVPVPVQVVTGAAPAAVQDDAVEAVQATAVQIAKTAVQQPAQQRVIRLVKINVSERRL